MEEGYAENFSDYSEYSKQIQNAEDNAKKQKIRRWANYVEEPKVAAKIENNQPIRKREIKYEEVVVIGLTSEAHIYVQKLSDRVELESFFERVQNVMQTSVLDTPVLKRGNLCAARFSQDGNWYRARIEKVAANRAEVFYIDYGNREVSYYF